MAQTSANIWHVVRPEAPPTLETLPLEIFQKICLLLFPDGKKSNLYALSLTSQYCALSTKKYRFEHLSLKVWGRDELESEVKKMEALGLTKVLRYLKISGNVQARNDGTLKKFDSSDERTDGGKRHNRIHRQLPLLSGPSTTYDEKQMIESPWLPLARFISRLHVLRDLVFACADPVPPCIISAMPRRCPSALLHIHKFAIPSMRRPHIGAEGHDLYKNSVAISPLLCVVVSGDDRWKQGLNVQSYRIANGCSATHHRAFATEISKFHDHAASV